MRNCAHGRGGANRTQQAQHRAHEHGPREQRRERAAPRCAAQNFAHTQEHTGLRENSERSDDQRTRMPAAWHEGGHSAGNSGNTARARKERRAHARWRRTNARNRQRGETQRTDAHTQADGTFTQAGDHNQLRHALTLRGGGSAQLRSCVDAEALSNHSKMTCRMSRTTRNRSRTKKCYLSTSQRTHGARRATAALTSRDGGSSADLRGCAAPTELSEQARDRVLHAQRRPHRNTPQRRSGRTHTHVSRGANRTQHGATRAHSEECMVQAVRAQEIPCLLYTSPSPRD